jgi:hypothetical protein
MACPTGKRMYPTEVIAEEELLAAWATYRYRPGNGPVAVYRCGDCGAFHFTSKGPMNETLSRFLESGNFRTDQEGRWWSRKLKP